MQTLKKPIVGQFYIYDHSDYTNLALCFRVNNNACCFVEHDNGAEAKLWFNKVSVETFNKKFIEENYNNLNYAWQYDCFRTGLQLLFEKRDYYEHNYGPVSEVDIFDIQKAIIAFSERNNVSDFCGINIDYKTYLQSPHWKQVRYIKLQQSGNKCQVCGSKNKLEVHHNSYDHIGKEEMHLEDLVVLCHNCHSLFHHKS